ALVAVRSALLGRLDRLTVDNGRAGGRLAPKQAAHALAQHGVDPLPRAGQAPQAKIVVDGGPRPVLARQIAPGAAAAQKVEEAIENPAEVNTAGAASRLGSRKQGFELGPLAIAEITGVENCGHETPWRLPAGESRPGQPCGQRSANPPSG